MGLGAAVGERWAGHLDTPDRLTSASNEAELVEAFHLMVHGSRVLSDPRPGKNTQHTVPARFAGADRLS